MQTQRSTLRSNLHADDERGLGEKRRGHVRPRPLLFSLQSRSSPSRFSIVPTDRLNPTRILVMKMDLFDIKLRLGVSRSHSVTVRDNYTVLNVTLHLLNVKSRNGLILAEVNTESQSTTLKLFDYK